MAWAILSAAGFLLGVTGSLLMSDRYSLTARAGAYFWDGNAEINQVTAATPSEANPYFSVGGRYQVAERFAVMADAGQFDLDGTRSDVVSVGFEVGF